MNIKSVILAFILVSVSISVCNAQEWDVIMNNYNQSQIERPVTPQEYNKALETITGYQKQGEKKQKKKKGKSQDSESKPSEEKEYIVPSSPGYLLRLPAKVRTNETVVPDGFYLVEKVIKGDKYFLKIMQGGKKVAEIPAQVIQAKYSGNTEVKIEHINNNELEIQYIDKEVSLRAKLTIYTLDSAEQF